MIALFFFCNINIYSLIAKSTNYQNLLVRFIKYLSKKHLRIVDAFVLTQKHNPQKHNP